MRWGWYEERMEEMRNTYAGGFEASTTVMFQVGVFWVVTQFSIVARIPTFQRSELPPSSG
jgi:hypothetical protein